MNNKKEEFAVRKPGIPKRNLIVAVVALAVMSGVCAYLAFSKNGRDFLWQGGAIAVRSFGDVIAPSSDTIISEVDIAHREYRKRQTGWPGEAVAVPRDTPTKNGNRNAVGAMRDTTITARKRFLCDISFRG